MRQQTKNKLKNKKGQALVEFVIILPIFIFMLLSIIDIGKIIMTKTRLESELSDVIDLYKNKKTYTEITDELNKQDHEVSLEVQNKNNEDITFFLKKKVTIVTPGLNAIFNNPYEVVTSRVISYE